MKSMRIPNRQLLLVLVSIGLAVGILVTALCWIFPAAMSDLLSSALWPEVIILVGALLILIGAMLAEKTGYLGIPKPVLFLAVAAATALVYLFPELFAPGCNGMPKAFAACPASCQISTCSNWIPLGGRLPNGGTCTKSNPWDIGCCVSYSTTCDPDCDTGGGGGGGNDSPPTITGTVACTTLGNSGWCRSGAMLNLSASDPQGYTITISGDIAGTSFSCVGPTCSRVIPEGSGTAHFQATASTSGMSSAGGSITFAYDPTPPTASLVIAGTPGAAGWYTAASASATGSDATSGVSVKQVAVDGGAWQTTAVLAEGTHSVMGRAIDNAGNSTVTSAQIVKVDATAPTVLASITSGTQIAGWYVSDATIKATASDATSGIAHVENRVDGGAWSDGDNVTISSEGMHNLEFRATDRAGLHSTTSISVKVDKTGPPITFTPTGMAGSNGWYVTPVSLSISAQDVLSGVASIEYRLGSGSWTPGNSLALGDGEYIVEARATDNAGNQMTSPTTIRVDTVSPEPSPSVVGETGNLAWYVSNVIVSANPSDATSGVALTEYRVDEGNWQTGDTTPAVSGDGAHTAEFHITDKAGNQSHLTRYFWIDVTPPSSEFIKPVEGSTNTLYGKVSFSGWSSDVTSGMAMVQISLDDGASWESLSLAGNRWSHIWDTRQVRDGTYTILAHAGDVAGNMEHTARTTVIVANSLPKVKVQDWWWPWQPGQVVVKPALVPIKRTTITISCSPYHKDVVLHFDDTNTVPSELQWDRHCGEGAYAADSGDYPVTVKACDIFGRCTEDEGAIKVPFFAPPLPTWTPSLAPTATVAPEKTRQVQKPQPTESVLPAVVSENQLSAPLPVPAPTWPWFAFALVGLFTALAGSSLADSRPRALKRLGKTMGKVVNGQK